MLAGSIVALVTPMHRSGEIDWPALDRLIDWHVGSGTHGIVRTLLRSVILGGVGCLAMAALVDVARPEAATDVRGRYHDRTSRARRQCKTDGLSNFIELVLFGNIANRVSFMSILSQPENLPSGDPKFGLSAHPPTPPRLVIYNS